MWNSLGFRESPYNTKPLKVSSEDVELLVGRDDEAIEFYTALENSHNGVLILSGAPGVGKTSFFNVAQFQLENKQSAFGPKLLSARQLCPVQPNDDIRTLSIRALDSLIRSVEEYCHIKRWKIPEQTQKIRKWMRNEASTSLDFGIDILGYGGSIGRAVTLPNINDVTFEGVADAISAITSEVISVLEFEGAIIALDNMENLHEDAIQSHLISLRDTLFAIPNLWWVLIGQSGLGSLIQSLDSRVFERINGSIEINPVTLDELDLAICKRVIKFHSSGDGKAPLPKTVHEALFSASFGEMRFVFKYSNAICTKFVENLRKTVLEQFKAMPIREGSKETIPDSINRAIASHLISDQISHERSMSLLKELIRSELDGLHLTPKEKSVLIEIGKLEKVRAKDHAKCGVKTMQDFSSNYLVRMAKQNLLVSEQEGRAVYYRLRGMSRLSHSFGLLN